MGRPLNEILDDTKRNFDGMFDINGTRDTNNAIEAQAQAARDAAGVQKYIFDESRKDIKPWMDVGLTALGDLANPDFQRDFTMADFKADPGYNFRMSEGQKAIERSAAARGGLNSGATLKALTKFGQNVASEEYNQAYNRFNMDRDRRFNRFASLAGLGQTATGQQLAAGQNYATQASETAIGLGNANAAAHIGSANRRAGLLGQLMQAGAVGYAASDRRLKTNIRPVSKADLDEFRSTIKPYMFEYLSEQHGLGDVVGVMAQDLEKSKLGRMIVDEDANGFKRIDIRKLASLCLAAMAA
jgi:hypothetical protein